MRCGKPSNRATKIHAVGLSLAQYNGQRAGQKIPMHKKSLVHLVCRRLLPVEFSIGLLKTQIHPVDKAKHSLKMVDATVHCGWHQFPSCVRFHLFELKFSRCYQLVSHGPRQTPVFWTRIDAAIDDKSS